MLRSAESRSRKNWPACRNRSVSAKILQVGQEAEQRIRTRGIAVLDEAVFEGMSNEDGAGGGADGAIEAGKIAGEASVEEGLRVE